MFRLCAILEDGTDCHKKDRYKNFEPELHKTMKP